MAGAPGRPLIAVTGPRRGGLAPRLLVSLAVRLAGGRPERVTPGRSRAPERFDGMVITGGHDVEPVLYAAEPEVEPRYDRERDALESAMIDMALARATPLLGICRGAQLLNVQRGGTLFQDLGDRRDRTSKRRSVLPLKAVHVEAGSRLAGILGHQRLRVNSLHNQAVDRVGSRLRVVARDLDGIVQGVEDPARTFCIGVQWHPEMLPWSARQRRLFRALVDAARERQRL